MTVSDLERGVNVAVNGVQNNYKPWMMRNAKRHRHCKEFKCYGAAQAHGNPWCRY